MRFASLRTTLTITSGRATMTNKSPAGEWRVFTATISASDCDCRDATSACPRSSRTFQPWYRAARDTASPRTPVFSCDGSGRPPSVATSDSRCRRRSASAASCPWRTPARSGRGRGAWSGHPSWGPTPAKCVISMLGSVFKFGFFKSKFRRLR